MNYEQAETFRNNVDSELALFIIALICIVIVATIAYKLCLKLLKGVTNKKDNARELREGINKHLNNVKRTDRPMYNQYGRQPYDWSGE